MFLEIRALAKSVLDKTTVYERVYGYWKMNEKIFSEQMHKH